MAKVPDKVDEDFRMSLVAMKDKLLYISKKYKIDFFAEAIGYLKDVKDINKIDYSQMRGLKGGKQ